MSVWNALAMNIFVCMGIFGFNLKLNASGLCP